MPAPRAENALVVDDDINPRGQNLLQQQERQDEEAEIFRELETLSGEIRRHDEVYYSHRSGDGDEPEIDDAAYDALVAREAQLCRDYPHLLQRLEESSGLGRQTTRFGGRVGPVLVTTTTDTPTNTTTTTTNATIATTSTSASSLDRFQKRQHLAKMYSLNNALSTDDVLAWLERIRKAVLKQQQQQSSPEDGIDDEKRPTKQSQVEFLTEPKLDGLSLSLRYSRKNATTTDGDDDDDKRQWKFEWAATRGDGTQGQDVSVAVEHGLNVPLTLDWPVLRVDDDGDDDDVPLDQKDAALEIRGEVVLPQSAFESLLQKNGTEFNVTFSNARNAASGILLRSKQLADDSEVRRLRQSLQFYAYGVVVATPTTTTATVAQGQDAASELLLPGGVELRQQLVALGFRVPEPTTTTVLTLDNNDTEWTEKDIQPMLDYHAALERHKQQDPDSKSKRKGALKFDDYDMDGCVHKVSAQGLRQLLGHTPRAPRWAIAHKFAAETVVTKILAVDLQVGRTGALTPVAKLEPVELNGVLIQRATLHNFAHMQQALGSDRIPVGTSVLIRRAGEVIPQVLRRVDSGNTIIADSDDAKNGDDDGNETQMISLQVPDKCPACGSPVAMDEVNRTGAAKAGTVGQVLRCTGPPLLCQPRAVSAMVHAFSRDALDVTGISQARLEKLMSLGILQSPADLFLFAKNETKMQNLTSEDGWGTKSVQNLVDKVNSNAEKGVSLTRFIYSLGIRFVGLQSSALLAGAYGKVDGFLTDVEAVSKLADPYEESFAVLREDNEATKGIGPSLLSALVEFSLQPELVKAAVSLANSISVHDEQAARSDSPVDPTDVGAANGPLAGLKIVFTGGVSGLSRSKAKEMAKAMGAKTISNAVSKSTDLVVAGAKGGKKLEEAEKHGVRILSGDEFLQMVQDFESGN